MDFNQYQEACKETAIYPEAGQAAAKGMVTPGLTYVVLGLTSEIAEVAGKVKKLIRDKGSVLDEASQRDLMFEAGDCLYYISALATELGFSLGDVALYNRNKLQERKRRGVLQGSGDHR